MGQPPAIRDDDYLYSRYASKQRQNTRNKYKFSSACRSCSPQDMKRYRMIQGIPHYLDARSSSSTGLMSPLSTRYSPRAQSPTPPYHKGRRQLFPNQYEEFKSQKRGSREQKMRGGQIQLQTARVQKQLKYQKYIPGYPYMNQEDIVYSQKKKNNNKMRNSNNQVQYQDQLVHSRSGYYKLGSNYDPMIALQQEQDSSELIGGSPGFSQSSMPYQYSSNIEAVAGSQAQNGVHPHLDNLSSCRSDDQLMSLNPMSTKSSPNNNRQQIQFITGNARGNFIFENTVSHQQQEMNYQQQQQLQQQLYQQQKQQQEQNYHNKSPLKNYKGPSSSARVISIDGQRIHHHQSSTPSQNLDIKQLGNIVVKLYRQNERLVRAVKAGDPRSGAITPEHLQMEQLSTELYNKLIHKKHLELQESNSEFNPDPSSQYNNGTLPNGFHLTSSAPATQPCINDIIHLLTSLSQQNESLLKQVDSVADQQQNYKQVQNHGNNFEDIQMNNRRQDEQQASKSVPHHHHKVASAAIIMQRDSFKTPRMSPAQQRQSRLVKKQSHQVKEILAQNADLKRQLQQVNDALSSLRIENQQTTILNQTVLQQSSKNQEKVSQLQSQLNAVKQYSVKVQKDFSQLEDQHNRLRLKLGKHYNKEQNQQEKLLIQQQQQKRYQYKLSQMQKQQEEKRNALKKELENQIQELKGINANLQHNITEQDAQMHNQISLLNEELNCTQSEKREIEAEFSIEINNKTNTIMDNQRKIQELNIQLAKLAEEKVLYERQQLQIQGQLGTERRQLGEKLSSLKKSLQDQELNNSKFEDQMTNDLKESQLKRNKMEIVLKEKNQEIERLKNNLVDREEARDKIEKVANAALELNKKSASEIEKKDVVVLTKSQEVDEANKVIQQLKRENKVLDQEYCKMRQQNYALEQQVKQLQTQNQQILAANKLEFDNSLIEKDEDNSKLSIQNKNLKNEISQNRIEMMKHIKSSSEQLQNAKQEIAKLEREIKNLESQHEKKIKELQRDHQVVIDQKNRDISGLKVKLADSVAQQQFVTNVPLNLHHQMRKSSGTVRADYQDRNNNVYSPVSLLQGGSECQGAARTSLIESQPYAVYPFKQYKGLEEVKANQSSSKSPEKQLKTYSNILKHSRSFACQDQFRKTMAFDQQFVLNHLLRNAQKKRCNHPCAQCNINKQAGCQDVLQGTPTRTTKDANVGKDSPSEDTHSIGVGSTPRILEEDAEDELHSKSQREQMIEHYVKHIKTIIFIQRKFRDKLLKRWMEEKSAAHKMNKSMKKTDCVIF